ncbi:MAG TPA: glycosyltransferase family 39 protein [Planctomycetes bacterium]|nr:glycosyltransferase family 39 protein [Planctomycetota bacterium]
MANSSGGRWCSRGMVAVVLFFLLCRIPIVMREVGGQDEEWFAIPGWTILQDGVPRVPYAPHRVEDSAFYKVDKALLALPPLFYYLSAPLFAILPPTYSTARLVSMAAGVFTLILVYLIARHPFKEPLVGLFAAGLFSLSRPFFFPATLARPDMLCGMWGLAALWVMWRWLEHRRQRDLVLAGAFLGLGMLTHPFALIYCIQVGVWVLVVDGSWRQRLARSTLLIACSLAAFALWLPLIATFPDIFRMQFFSNVLDRSGPGLITRLLFPWPFVSGQAELLSEHAGLLQIVLMSGGLFLGTWFAWRAKNRPAQTLLLLTWSSIYLLVACQGSHPTKGYWCYPAALLFLCLGWVINRVGGLLWARSTSSRIVAVVTAALVLAALIPGSGVRTWWTYMRHRSNVNYDATRFVDRILADLPADARYTVDRAFVFNFHASDRSTLLAMTEKFFFDVEPFPYDYLIVSRHCMDLDIRSVLKGRLIGTYGDRDDFFSCYVEVYVPVDSPVFKISDRE